MKFPPLCDSVSSYFAVTSKWDFKMYEQHVHWILWSCICLSCVLTFDYFRGDLIDVQVCLDVLDRSGVRKVSVLSRNPVYDCTIQSTIRVPSPKNRLFFFFWIPEYRDILSAKSDLLAEAVSGHAYQPFCFSRSIGYHPVKYLFPSSIKIFSGSKCPKKLNLILKTEALLSRPTAFNNEDRTGTYCIRWTPTGYFVLKIKWNICETFWS